MVDCSDAVKEMTTSSISFFSFEEDTYNPGLDAAISFSHIKVDWKQPVNASTKLSKETLESREHYILFLVAIFDCPVVAISTNFI